MSDTADTPLDMEHLGKVRDFASGI
jgi:hypothetical protein